MKLATLAIAAVGFAALAISGASAVTIDFSAASLNGSNGFTVTGYSLTNGNCPGPAPCSSIPNLPNVVQVSANAGTFDFLSFLYQFQGSEGNGNLKVTSNLSLDPIGIISIVNPGNPQVAHLFDVAASSVASYFTGVSWIKFFSDTQANVRIDNVVVSAVPVPAGIALGAAGLGMLGLLGWRRKKTVVAA